MGGECSECGVPRLITRTHTWRDGCIVDKASGNANFCLYEVGFHNALFERLGANLGMPMDNIILSAGRQASARVIMDLLSSHPLIGRIAFKAPFYHLVQKMLVDFGLAIGIGRIEIIDHRKGRRGKVHYTDPYNLPHCTAILMGAIDAMYGYPVSADVHEEADGSFTGELLPGERKDAAADEAFLRLAGEDLKPAKTGIPHDLAACGKCGAPGDFGITYSFDLARGIITEQLDRQRAAFLGVYSINSILREFERELGQDIAGLFVRSEEESFKKRLALTLLAGEMKDEREIRDYFCLRGFGMLTGMEQEGEKAIFTVENAFIPPIVAGRLLALCEYRQGKKCDYEYSLEEATLRLSVSPRDGA